MNYDHLHGRTIPSFSWESIERFFRSGFGLCLVMNEEILACAFSASVSSEFVYIGIETSEAHRGHGYGKIIAAAMVNHVLSIGKIPVWACDTQNEGSKALACSIGFHISDTHPWIKL